jgi:hypothetical protein
MLYFVSDSSDAVERCHDFPDQRTSVELVQRCRCLFLLDEMGLLAHFGGFNYFHFEFHHAVRGRGSSLDDYCPP